MSTAAQIQWTEVNTILSTASVNGWAVSRHLEQFKYQRYLYIATKDGQKLICTHNWNEVKKEIYKSTVATLI